MKLYALNHYTSMLLIHSELFNLNVPDMAIAIMVVAFVMNCGEEKIAASTFEKVVKVSGQLTFHFQIANVQVRT
jgi:hypothetical protein